METITTTTRRRAGATTIALAVVGFITLIVLGIILAVYAARYVPRAASRVASTASAYLSFHKVTPPSLQVITASSTETVVPFVTATSTASTTAIASGETPVATHSATPVPAAGTKTTTVRGATAPVLYGLPDLQVQIEAVGYRTGSSDDTFVASDSVSNDNDVAVKFVILNTGTNASGAFRFTADIPTTSNSEFDSDAQQSLNPGERIEYLLAFDHADTGSQDITVTVDPDHAITESNENNNSVSRSIDITN